MFISTEELNLMKEFSSDKTRRFTVYVNRKVIGSSNHFVMAKLLAKKNNGYAFDRKCSKII